MTISIDTFRFYQVIIQWITGCARGGLGEQKKVCVGDKI